MKFTQASLLLLSVTMFFFGGCTKNSSIKEVRLQFLADPNLQKYISVENQLNKQLTAKVKATLTNDNVKQYIATKQSAGKEAAVEQFRQSNALSNNTLLNIEQRKENAKLYIQLYLKYVKEYDIPKKVFSDWMKEALVASINKK